MRRRALLAAAPPAAATALLPAAALAPSPAAAQAPPSTPPALVTEEFMVPSRDTPGIELFLRNKRPESLTAFAPGRTLLFVHGATYPAHTAFDLPLVGLSWMDYIAARGFDVWCVDLRGYGRSTRPAEMAQPPEANPPLVRGETAVADIASAATFIRERRGLPRLVHMGWSWGTALTARFAADNPSLVERVVLYAPLWTLSGPPPIGGGTGPIGAYRTVTQAQARQRWLNGVPADKAAGLIPPGWFEHWAGVTWATDPEGMRRNPPALRAPNGVLQDLAEFWAPGKEPFYDPAKIRAPALLVVAEWDRDTPPSMAATLFPLLTSSPGKRLVVLGEGTHSIIMERNRGALFQAVQVFLEEAIA
jgi:pimeloyl-ACP methyl ester carboxylesterase